MKQRGALSYVVRHLIICLLLCACLILGSDMSVWAWDKEESSGSEESFTSTASIGDTKLIIYSDGHIAIEMTATTASNSWRWRTIGFYFTTKPVSVNTATLSGTCPSNIPAKSILWLDVYNCKCSACPHYGHRDSEDRTDSSRDGITRTTITLSRECVMAHLRAAGIDPAANKGGEIYFQGVLGFYNGATYKYGPFYSVNQARSKNRALGNGRDWSFYPRSSGEGWVKRYNIGMKYHPNPTVVKIKYYRKNTNTDKAAGATTTWSEMKAYNSKDDRSKWTSTVDTYASLDAGNGLGFDKTDYYVKDKIALSKYSAPRLLSDVVNKPADSNYDNYFAYRFSWSKGTSAVSKTSGMAKQSSAYVYTGVILDENGVVTEDYKEWLRDARVREYACTSPDVGLVLNVCYKKAKSATTPPEESTDTDTDMAPRAKATIQSDKRGADTSLDMETYDSTEGIPSSEPQYVNVFAKAFLYTVDYSKKTASKTYSYHEGCYWVDTSHTEGEGDDAVLVPGGYWHHEYGSCTLTCDWEEVAGLGIWKIDHSDVANRSLPDETETLYPHGYAVNVPDVAYAGGVVSWAPYGTAPCGGAGAPNPGDTMVKSGRLRFNGTTVLSDAVRSQHGGTHTDFPKPETIGNDVLYENGYMIPPALANDTYISRGTITYTSVVNANTSYGNTLDFEISKINDVVVHTPTVSYAEVPNDAKAHCQLVIPSANAQLVLDQYFTVCDNSYGYHSNLRGYGTRNYTRFIAKKEVIFPFDVYRCNADGSIGTFIPAGNWTELDLVTGKGTFYLPVWANEGDYSVNFRSRTINCDANVGTDEAELDAVTEEMANADLENYLSTASTDVEVSGRLFDLAMYDISDYPAWGDRVFRQPDSTRLTGLRYTVGLNDRNGNQYRPGSSAKYTFSPVDGSHPYLKNYGVLKPGYVQRFYLTTFGDMNMDGDYVDIRPTFYYVTGAGASQTRTKVDLYYDETISGKREHFVKVGSGRNEKNVKSMSIGDLYASVPDAELSDKAALSGGTVADLKTQTGARYRYDRIVIPLSSATFVGDRYIPASGIPSGVDYSQVKMAAQKWYFEYSLPANVHAVPMGTTVDAGRGGRMSVDDYAATYGIDYTEDFWCSGGYLIVNWTIRTVSSSFTNEDGAEGEDINVGGGSPAYRLDYINHGNWARGFCNMWNREGFQYAKTDSSGKVLNFMDGDVCMYYTSEGSGGNKGDSSGGGSGSVRDDYKSYGTH